MKYSSLKNKPNVSRTRFSSFSPSMKLDRRGFPHISWFENKNGRNEVKYSFWDGLKWSYLSQSQVYISEEDINYSPSSIVLDSDDNPHIVFSKDMSSGSRLSVAYHDDIWKFNYIDVSYDVGWVGIVHKEQLSGSSSSSSSQDSGDSSYYVIVYDITNLEFKVYSVNNSWNLVGSISESVNSYSSIKITFCDFSIAIAFIEDGYSIKYNFFDTITGLWRFSPFSELTASYAYGDIISMDLVGYNIIPGEGICVGWISSSSSSSYVSSAVCLDTGAVYPTGSSYNLESNPVYFVISDSDYIVNGYKKIGITISDGGDPVIVCIGLSSKAFYYDGVSSWNVDLIDLEASGNGNVFTYLDVEYFSDVKIAFGLDTGDIYYFESTDDEEFQPANPEIFLLNQDYYAYRLTDFENSSGEYILGLYNNFYGGVLRDAKSPLMVASNVDTNVSSSSSSSGD